MRKRIGETVRGVGSGFSFSQSSFGNVPATTAPIVFGATVGTRDGLGFATTSSSTERMENKPFPEKDRVKAVVRQAGAFQMSRFKKVNVTAGWAGGVQRERRHKEPGNKIKYAQPKLESQWRNVEWTEEQKTSLMKTISSYRPRCEEVTQARVLLLGPVSSGKSSFISSVQSVFNGRVTNRAMVGSSLTSFTKKLQSFTIHGQNGGDTNGLVLCDVMGLGDGEMTGLTLHDVLSVIKGHVPEGHKFSPDKPVSSETVGYVQMPSFKDKIHCVAFVVKASEILTYPKSLSTTFQQLREHIGDLGVHQVALLTHIDQICPETAKDVTQVYNSSIIRNMMDKAGALLGMSTSYIVPVKNYSSELDVNVNTDVLLLSAVDHILQYADLYFQDNTPQYTCSKTEL